MSKFRYIKGREIDSNEHMLYLGEIAQLYGLFSRRVDDAIGGYPYKPHAMLVKAAIMEYMKGVGITEEDSYYYPAGKGLSKVYPKELYQPAMAFFFSQLGEGEVGKYFTTYKHTMKNGKTFTFIYTSTN